MKKTRDKAKEVLVNVYTDLTAHWKKPANGNYVSYKEMLNYSIGGMGQQMLIMFIGYFGLGAANTLLGSTIGIRPMHLQSMAVVQQILNVFLYIIRSKIVDNTRTKWGRFRPYMFIASIPVLVLGVSFLFLNFAVMSYSTKLFYVFAFAISISALSPFFTDTYTELATVITPNSRERAKFYSITSLVYSFAPTIYMFMIPILSNLTGGFNNINTYRYVIAPLAVLGFLLNLFVVFGCKEKVVTSRTYVQKVSTFKACFQIFKNKYWWIRTMAGALGFLEGAFNAIFLWTFMYGAQDLTTYAFLVTVQGSASAIAMLITPWVLKRFGNRLTLLGHNILNVLLIGLMVFTFQSPGLFFVLLYVNTIVNQLQIVYAPAMHSEVKDYQQYKSGKRLDFTFGAAGQILLPFTILSGFVIPFVYESLGLTTNYDIMYDPVMRNKLFLALCVLSVVGAALNLIPYFFYKMTREKHGVIIDVLQLRAGLEDYASGDISPARVKAMLDGVNRAHATMAAEIPDIKADKAAIKTAKAMPKITDEEKSARKVALKEARKKIYDDRSFLFRREGVIEIMLPELAKYDSLHMQLKVQIAGIIANCPIEELVYLDISNIEFNPGEEGSREHRLIAKLFDKEKKKLAKMQNKICKVYPNGLVANNREALDLALDLPRDTKELNTVRNTALKIAEKEYNRYCLTLAMYFECESEYKQYQGKLNFSKIEEMFDDAVIELEELEALSLAEEARIKAERVAELDRIFTAKKNKKAAKKGIVIEDDAAQVDVVNLDNTDGYDSVDSGIDENNDAAEPSESADSTSKED